jgi:hypothetical protein
VNHPYRSNPKLVIKPKPTIFEKISCKFGMHEIDIEIKKSHISYNDILDKNIEFVFPDSIIVHCKKCYKIYDFNKVSMSDYFKILDSFKLYLKTKEMLELC